MEPESAEPILALWIFSVAAAHVFAGYWLAQAFLLSHPDVRYRLKQHARRLKFVLPNEGRPAAAGLSWLQQLFFCDRKQSRRDSNEPGCIESQPSPHDKILQGNQRMEHSRGSEIHGSATAASCSTGTLEREAEAAAAALIDAVLAREPIPIMCPAPSSQHLDPCQPLTSPFAPHQSALMELPAPTRPPASHARISLEWRNLSHSVPTPSGPRALLRGVWGSVYGGEMMALMGASGAGKSTLLELLTLRRAPSAMSTLPPPPLALAPKAPRTVAGRLAPAALSTWRAAPAGNGGGGSDSHHVAFEVHDGREGGGSTGVPGKDGCFWAPESGERGISSSSGGGSGETQGAWAGECKKERGVLLLNGQPARASHMRRVCSYIPQDDSLLPQMTVAEVLQLYAALTLPPGTPRPESEHRQHMVLAAMGLWHARHTLVGGILPGGLMLRGLSGGERKRLSIGAALIPQPQLIFADEPTSGLDAFAALSVMAYLAAMVRMPAAAACMQRGGPPGEQHLGETRGGCAVLVSIHQPRAAIWDMFDKVLLLAHGRMVYEGSSQGSAMVDWFMQCVPRALSSWAVPCTQQQQQQQQQQADLQLHYVQGHHGTPADWVMDLLTSPSLDSEQLMSRGLVSAIDQGSPQHTQHKGSTPHQQQDGAHSCARIRVAGGSAAEGRGRHWAEVAADAFGAHYLRAMQQQQQQQQQPQEQEQALDTCKASLQHKQHQPQSAQQPGTQEPDHAGPEDQAGMPIAPVAGARGLQRQRRCDQPLLQRVHMWGRRYRALVWREWLLVTRNPTDVAGRMLIFVWVSILGNFLMYSGGQAGEGAGRIRVTLGWTFSAMFFFLVMPFLFMSVYNADKKTYLADISAGLYTPGPFYAAKLTTTLPLNILIAVFFTWTGYGMFGYRHSGLALVQFTAISCIFSLVALQWIYFATTLAPNQDIAFVLAVAFAVVNLLITAFFMGPMDPPGWPWVERLRYISALDYAWQGVAAAELRGRVYSCVAGGAQGTGVDALGIYPDVVPPTPTFDLLLRGLQNPPANCAVDADAVLEYYKVDPNVGAHFGALVAYLLILHFLTYGSLRWNTARLVCGGRK